MVPFNSQKVLGVLALGFLLVIEIIFAFYVKYGDIADPLNENIFKNNTSEDSPDSQYPMFQDIHVMIFVGFGFLMTFLKKYAFSAVGFNFFIAAVAIQWAILCQGFWKIHSVRDYIPLNIISLMNADIAAAAVLISFGAVLGKTSALQLFIMTVLEIALFSANEHLGTEIFKAVDAGGSMYVHVFGAYFGLAVSFILAQGYSIKEQESSLESSSYQSDLNSMIGTLFLWLFWPSFNAGLLTEDEKYRAIINTYLSLTGSCISVFAYTVYFDKEKKFKMVYIQNATLAGGVCVGTICNMKVMPFGALIIGIFAGATSAIGFKFIQKFILKIFHIHDTCGVNNLHGIPGILSGISGIIMAGLANYKQYGSSLFEVFPAMGPNENRSALQQAAYQAAGLGATLGLAIAGGLLTGVLLRFVVPGVFPSEYYDDKIWWNVEEEEQ